MKIYEAYITLCGMKECYFCKAKFLQGIVFSTPGEMKVLDAFSWFNGGYLHHVQTTHGIDPESLTSIMKKVLL